MSETFRHQCEVRWCLQRGFDVFEGYVAKVKKERGSDAAKALWDDVRTQHQLGNRGAANDWRRAPT